MFHESWSIYLKAPSWSLGVQRFESVIIQGNQCQGLLNRCKYRYGGRGEEALHLFMHGVRESPNGPCTSDTGQQLLG